MLIGKLLTKCLSKPVILNLDRLNILKKHRITRNFCILSQKWISSFIERRRENGWGVYDLLNIQKGEKAKIAQQQSHIDKFFDAPAGLFFTVNQALGIGAKMDIAMIMQNVIIAAKVRDSGTCLQAA